MPIGLAALIPAAISGIGSLLSNRKGDQTKSTGTQETSRTGTTTTTDSLGPEAISLIQQILPQILQMTRGGSVDPGYADQIAQQQTMGANQSADAIRDTLAGNTAARGLTYSAPAGLARGVAESFRGNAFNSILQNQATNNIDIARGNRAEQTQGLGLAQNILNILPQSRTTQDNSTITGTNAGNVQQKSGSLIGDALQLGSNIFSAYKGLGQPGQFNLPQQSQGAGPTQSAVPQLSGAPNLSYQVPQLLTPSFNPSIPHPLKDKPMVNSSISYAFD